MEEKAYDPAGIDLTNCDREPIHLLGRVQDFGALLAVSQDWIVQHASANTAEIFGIEAEDLIGTPLKEHFPYRTIHEIRGRLQFGDRQNGLGRLFDKDLMGDGRKYDIAVHTSGRSFVIEIEPRNADREDRMDQVRSLMARVSQKPTLDAALSEAAHCLTALTGFDRVMIYKFHPDESGEVVAETILRPGIEPFLGLRYPASDIPSQARELYVRNPIRIISDIDAPVHEVRPFRSPEGQILDLSLAVTRAVSPVHIEYLRNMGVRASMSVSILRRGKLWGLFACHHYDPKVLEFDLRTACELFGQLFSYELAQRESETELAEMERARTLHDRIMSQASDHPDFTQNLPDLSSEIGQVLAHDGIAVFVDGKYRAYGAAPTEEEFLGLARFLNTAAASTVYATDSIARLLPSAEAYVSRAAGLLALPVSRTPRDYIVLFRRELTQVVRWAGNPEKPYSVGPHGVRLNPRKSFEAWQDVVREKSAPWSTAERRAAEALRITLLEVVLKLTDLAMKAKTRAQEQQDLLISELNHRVRNILNLIQGLVAQTQSGSHTIDSFTKELSGRIQALARAHDQLTSSNFAPTPLRDLIMTETRAYFDAGMDRVRLDGEELVLVPEAFSSLALVIHELMTNSAKYGALSDSRGHVQVTTSIGNCGIARIVWTEHDGPPVKAPKRRGFGTTLVERTIPHELNGTAELHFKLTGLRAEFTLPPNTFTVIDPIAPKGPELVAQPKPRAVKTPVGTSGKVLLVEDNIIIAMDATAMLESLGANQVITAARVEEALAVVRDGGLTFALLDLNLGNETSLPIARELQAQGVPFVFATGYGETDALSEELPGVPVLQKPYNFEALRDVMGELPS